MTLKKSLNKPPYTFTITFRTLAPPTTASATDQKKIPLSIGSSDDLPETNECSLAERSGGMKMNSPARAAEIAARRVSGLRLVLATPFESLWLPQIEQNLAWRGLSCPS
jgi:hypothetical protein